MSKTELNILRQLLAKLSQNVTNSSKSVILPSGLDNEDALGALSDVESIVKETMKMKHNWKFIEREEG
jgi:hypothetical protein